MQVRVMSMHGSVFHEVDISRQKTGNARLTVAGGLTWVVRLI